LETSVPGAVTMALANGSFLDTGFRQESTEAV
jgi:hypothetical protein